MKITLDNHPAQCQHKTGPNRGKPVIGADGKPIPLIPDQHLIRMDGVGIGYCKKEPNGWISIIDATLDPPVVAEIKRQVQQLRGDTAESSLTQTPLAPDLAEEEVDLADE